MFNLLSAGCRQVTALGAQESKPCVKSCTKAKLKLEIWPDSVESHCIVHPRPDKLTQINTIIAKVIQD